MDYTLSNGFQTDPGTGNRMHVGGTAIPTMVADADLNALYWELMAVIKGAGIVPVPFDKGNPTSYSQLNAAIAAMDVAAQPGIMNVAARVTVDQAIAVGVETILTATPSLMDTDLYSFSGGYYTVKKKGWFQVASRLSINFNAQQSYTHDCFSSIKFYKAGVVPTNANYFDGSTQYQPMPVTPSQMPTSFYRLVENRKLIYLDIGDRLSFLLYFVNPTGAILCADIPTRNSVFEFLYLGK